MMKHPTRGPEGGIAMPRTVGNGPSGHGSALPPKSTAIRMDRTPPPQPKPSGHVVLKAEGTGRASRSATGKATHGHVASKR